MTACIAYHAEDLGFQGCRFFPSQLGIVTLGTSLDAPPGDYPADRERAGRLPANDGEWHLAASAGDEIFIKCASPPAVVNCQVLRELWRPWAMVRRDDRECANV